MQCCSRRILLNFEPLNELNQNFTETYKWRFCLQPEYFKCMILDILHFYYLVNIFIMVLVRCFFFFLLENIWFTLFKLKILVNAGPLEEHQYSLSGDERWLKTWCNGRDYSSVCNANGEHRNILNLLELQSESIGLQIHMKMLLWNKQHINNV